MTGRAAVVLLALFAAGCGEDSSFPSSAPQVTIDASAASPPGTGLNPPTATTLVGVALVLDVETGDPDSTQTVSIRSADPSIATVVPSELPNTFFLIGWAPGQTALRVLLNGQSVDALMVAGSEVTTLEALVVAQ